MFLCLTLFLCPGVYAYAAGVTDSTVKLDAGNSMINRSEAGKYEDIVMTAKAKNAVGKVIYHYSYHSPGKPWVYLGDYVDSNTRRFRFSSGGTFYIRVGMKDESGAYSEKQFVVTVRSLDVSASSVSTYTAVAGTKIRLYAESKNAYGNVKYHYSYHAQGRPWTYVGDYTGETKKDFTFGWNNVYYLRVGAKDSSGEYKEKQFRICVYNKASKKTLADTQLQASPGWASKTLLQLSKGSAVNMIRGDGHWYCVRYKGYTGYIYNLALGQYKNFSAPDKSSMGYIADDIIFRCGRTLKGIFDYSITIPYRANKDLGYEQNVLYVMKYGRGACYQRASMLCFLFRRMGYESMVIKNAYTLDTHESHSWAIVKTENGWKHVDPSKLKVIGRSFLTNDARMAIHLHWDRSAYPACP